MRIKLATLVAFLLFWQLLFSQNLIPNSGFEEFQECPDGLRQLEKAKFWQKANAGTPELFHLCGFAAEEVSPFEGEGMAGIILLADYASSVEYLQVELMDSLVEGQYYCLSYQILVDQKSPIVINRIGAHFSAEALKSPNWTPFRKTPQVETESIIEKSTSWHRAESVFKAKGGEKYMTFGNFYPKYLLQEKVVSPVVGSWMSYYYLDNFHLKKVNISCNEYNIAGLPASNSETIWNHTVYFETDSFNLTALESLELKRFVDQLPQRVFSPVKVIGHTDAEASFEYNLNLSQQRARVVEEYLNGQGKSNTLISWSGEEKPLNQNKTEMEKANNRRVEIIIDRP